MSVSCRATAYFLTMPRYEVDSPEARASRSGMVPPSRDVTSLFHLCNNKISTV